MRNFILIALLGALFSCNSNDYKIAPKFMVSKHNVGFVTDSTLVKDLKVIFASDSIVNYKEDDSFVGGINPINIYSKSKTPLLHIFPIDAHDSTATIDFVEIKNQKFKTESFISTKSYFVDLKTVYPILEIKNKMNTIEVVVDSIKSTFVFIKLGVLQDFDFGTKIISDQIPDSTKIDAFIKFF